MAHNFRAAIFKGPGELEINDVTAPELNPGEVLVRVKACGICGSDLNIFKRNPPIPKFWGGHEISGEVAGLGPGVDGFKTGEKVSVAPLIPCGECEQCRAGLENICSKCLFISFNVRGGFSEYVTAPKENIYRLPESAALDEAVLLEPLADVIHSFKRAGGVQGKRVVVVGSGTIGLLTVNAAKALGALKALSVGKYPHQRSKAMELGADGVFDPAGGGLEEAILEKFEGTKADLVFETVGGYESESITQAINILRPGGTIILSGVHYKTPNMNLKNLTEREIEVKGTQRYRREDFAEAVELFGRGVIKAGLLVTHRVSLDRIMEGYSIAFDKHANKAVKVVVCP
ncbi:MAG: alcohol dehydrogenase catalytic domain-containing protein [Deltaproteobacteria bacterium]|nr:alcohol dehydrogenase catalytic domain-containing protein [Deltaproteobacteria bacterium]